MSKKIGNSPFIYNDQGTKATGVSNPDSTTSDVVVNFASVSDIPSNFLGMCRVNTDIYSGDGTFIDLADSSGRTAYQGVVATRCGIMDVLYPGTWWADGATVHVATESLTKIKVIHPNWCVIGLADSGTGGTLTLSVTIEYTLNGVKQLINITYGGLTTTVVSSGNNSNPDWTRVTLNKGQVFRVRYHAVWSSGMPSTTANYIPIYTSNALTEGQNNSSVANVTNQLAAANPTYSAGNIVFRPCAIIGLTNRITILITGDSISVGTKDLEDATLKQGFFERSISYGYINIARGGELAQVVTTTPANIAKRVALAQYCTHVLTNYGTNDLASGYTPAQVQGFLSSFYTQNFAGKPYIVCTLIPRSTGAWDTAANQTVTSYDSNISALNEIILNSGVTGQVGCIDLHEILSDTYVNNKWKTWGTTPTAITDDGIHPNHKGNIYCASKINIGQFI